MLLLFGLFRGAVLVTCRRGRSFLGLGFGRLGLPSLCRLTLGSVVRVAVRSGFLLCLRIGFRL